MQIDTDLELVTNSNDGLRAVTKRAMIVLYVLHDSHVFRSI